MVGGARLVRRALGIYLPLAAYVGFLLFPFYWMRSLRVASRPGGVSGGVPARPESARAALLGPDGSRRDRRDALRALARHGGVSATAPP